MDSVRFEEGRGGLKRVVISTEHADAEIYLQGAHVTHWQPKGQRPVLFMSPNSLFESGKAIRGGVPIVFPWFGPRSDGKPGPAHGFARTTEWDVEYTKQHEDGRVEIALVLGSSETSLAYRVTVGQELHMELEARNNGSEAFTFEEALHTYFAISDIRRVAVAGLRDTEYLDKTDSFLRKRVETVLLLFKGEKDQVHINTQSTCTILDPAWKRRIEIEKSGSNSTVVWNPWIKKAGAMPDLGLYEWNGMVCVESGNIGENAVTLAPGESHKMAVTIRIRPSAG